MYVSMLYCIRNYFHFNVCVSSQTVVALALVAVTLAAPSQPSYGYAPPATYDVRKTSIYQCL